MRRRCRWVESIWACEASCMATLRRHGLVRGVTDRRTRLQLLIDNARAIEKHTMLSCRCFLGVVGLTHSFLFMPFATNCKRLERQGYLDLMYTGVAYREDRLGRLQLTLRSSLTDRPTAARLGGCTRLGFRWLIGGRQQILKTGRKNSWPKVGRMLIPG